MISRRILLAGAPLVASRTVHGESLRVDLPRPHLEALATPQRIFFQCDTSAFDPPQLYGTDIDRWLAYRFGYADEPGSQIDTFCLDVSNEGLSPYPSRILPQWNHPGLRQWWDQGIDYIERLIAACHQRRLRCFWNHRVSEVERGLGGFRIGGGTEMEILNPVKRAHPDWVIRSWWWQGNWNLAAPGLRDYKLSLLDELLGRYDFDGLQLDFARHIPVLPPGRQWTQRDDVTQFVTMVRRLLLRRSAQRGHPILLAVRIPENLRGCRIDGFDVEQWVDRRLVDILTLGSRTVNVDLAAFRDLTRKSPVRLQPTLDDWHATDGYRNPPIEFFRGVFGNWLRQGAHSVGTFNWSSASPAAALAVGALAGPTSQGQANLEVGALSTLESRAHFYVIERRGGYPYAEGYFNRNDDALLPCLLANHGAPEELTLAVWEDISRPARLHLVFFALRPDDTIAVEWNGTPLTPTLRDPAHTDAQIFSPGPQPVSGGQHHHRAVTSQSLTRLEFVLAPGQVKKGANRLILRVATRGVFRPAEFIKVEKAELHLA